MAIIRETLDNGLIRTYSNKGVKIHGGYPEADYDIVYDPEDKAEERIYTETNIPVDDDSKGNDLSRVKLYRRFSSMGIWDQVKAWMQSQPGVWEEWEYSTTLERDNQLVKNAILALKNIFGLDDETINDIMESSIAC